MNVLQNWRDYQPSKAALAWAAVGASVLTMVIGFTWGGWVTGGTARDEAQQVAATARAELVSSICVERFRTVDTARAQYEELTELSSFRRRQFVESAEWAKLPDGGPLSRQAAERCAQEIAELDPETLPNPVAVVEDVVEDSESVVQ